MALCLGGLLGWFAAPVIAAAHPAVRLLADVEAHRATDAVAAFEASGTPLAQLQNEAAQARHVFDWGLPLGGVLLAGAVMVELIAESRRRGESRSYKIDPSLCVCCGRCYAACPLNIKRNSEKGAAS